MFFRPGTTQTSLGLVLLVISTSWITAGSASRYSHANELAQTYSLCAQILNASQEARVWVESIAAERTALEFQGSDEWDREFKTIFSKTNRHDQLLELYLEIPDSARLLAEIGPEMVSALQSILGTTSRLKIFLAEFTDPATESAIESIRTGELRKFLSLFGSDRKKGIRRLKDLIEPLTDERLIEEARDLRALAESETDRKSFSELMRLFSVERYRELREKWSRRELISIHQLAARLSPNILPPEHERGTPARPLAPSDEFMIELMSHLTNVGGTLEYVRQTLEGPGKKYKSMPFRPSTKEEFTYQTVFLNLIDRAGKVRPIRMNEGRRGNDMWIMPLPSQLQRGTAFRKIRLSEKRLNHFHTNHTFENYNFHHNAISQHKPVDFWAPGTSEQTILLHLKISISIMKAYWVATGGVRVGNYIMKFSTPSAEWLYQLNLGLDSSVPDSAFISSFFPRHGNECVLVFPDEIERARNAIWDDPEYRKRNAYRFEDVRD